jgi:hypothetical protein
MLERFGAVRVLLNSLEKKRVVEFVNGNDKAKLRFGILFFREDFSPRARKPVIYRLKGQLAPTTNQTSFRRERSATSTT